MAKSTCSFFLLINLLLGLYSFPPAHAHGVDYLQKVCKRAVRYDESIEYDFCIRTLEAAPGSLTTELYGLLAITTNLAAINATSTARLFYQLSAVACNQLVKAAMSECLQVYKGASLTLWHFAKARSSVADPSDSVAKLGFILEATSGCQSLLGDEAAIVKKETHSLFQLVSMARAFTHFVTRRRT